MTAHVHHTGTRRHPAAAHAEARLPWWALALPALAFLALLLLLVSGDQAAAAQGGAALPGPGISGLLERLRESLPF
ncbi:hypothetical protein [Streptomyces sp. JJ36]|uniref:hypothetical protein n=1 Tax=Streptomyces sp. JJ36 TaxID=2736645 RepID=UPI001F30107F|nr:hypothetical protein [Streptomyces sp. JJ36]MCF6525729.1 hypothetical protein [Streptomyces sp. JJ36]